jgi:hypothetical protein
MPVLVSGLVSVVLKLLSEPALGQLAVAAAHAAARKSGSPEAHEAVHTVAKALGAELPKDLRSKPH